MNNQALKEMVTEYRHLFFERKKVSDQGALRKANAIGKNLSCLEKKLETLGFPIVELIEELKLEYHSTTKYNQVVVFSDGGVRNHHDLNKNLKAASAFILYGDKNKLKQQERYLGDTFILPSKTEVKINSVLAEYSGLIQALDYVIENKIKAEQFVFVTDCIIMVEQITGKRDSTNRVFTECVEYCRNRLSMIKNAKIKHVTREKNKWADSIVNNILDEYER